MLFRKIVKNQSEGKEKLNKYFKINKNHVLRQNWLHKIKKYLNWKK